MERHQRHRGGRGGRWRIGELATLAGTTARAIRLYHSEGLLPEPERSESGYRLYGSADLAGLIRILRLRSLGFGIDQIRELISTAKPVGLSDALGELSSYLDQRIEELRAAIELIAQVRSEEGAERELYARLAPVLRKALETGKDVDPDAPQFAPLAERLTRLQSDDRWPALSARLRRLRDTPLAAQDFERLAKDLARVVPAGLLPDQLADPVVPTVLLGARFSKQQMEVIHRAAEIQRGKRRSRK